MTTLLEEATGNFPHWAWVYVSRVMAAMFCISSLLVVSVPW